MAVDYRILCFTSRGQQLADAIAGILSKADPDTVVITHRVKSLADTTRDLFCPDRVLIFIGAAAIAVRAVAPLLQGKTQDPAVIVIDENGEFVIPIISGHIGKANRYARQIANLIAATAVITTATDTNGVFAFDAFASEQGYTVFNPEEIKLIASTMLEGKTVGLASDYPIISPLPGLVTLTDSGSVGVVISTDTTARPFTNTLNLIPRCYHIGMGTRRGVDPQALEEFFLNTLAENTIPVQSIAAVASIDIKADEPALTALAAKYRLAFITYSSSELADVADRFTRSDFVCQITGTGSVCEAAAWLSADRGELVVPKTVGQGMTAAIARQKWTVSFPPESFDGNGVVHSRSDNAVQNFSADDQKRGTV